MSNIAERSGLVEKPTLLFAVVPLTLSIALVALHVFYDGDVSPHVPLAIGVIATAAIVGKPCKTVCST